jgi:hypothetical protein
MPPYAMTNAEPVAEVARLRAIFAKNPNSGEFGYKN